MVLICNDNDCSQKNFIKKISSKGVFVTTVTPTPSSSSSPIFDAIAVKLKKCLSLPQTSQIRTCRIKFAQLCLFVVCVTSTYM